MEHRDIVIVGGGMVGSALAAALSGRGLTVCVLEREAPQPFAPEQAPDLRVSAISPASAAFLDRLGTWEKITAMRAAPYRRMQVWEKDEAAGTLFDAAEAGVSELGHIVENRVVQLAATAALRDKGDIDYRCPAAVRDIIYRPQATQLTLDDGSRLQARLVIAADGARSQVREAAGIGVTSWDYPMHALVLACRMEGGQQDITWQQFTPTGPLAYLPLCGDAASLVWYHQPEEVKRLLALSDEDLIAAVSQAFPRKLPGIRQIAARGSFGLTRRHAQRYARDGVALAGDAAHTIHPLAGQGVNLGFQDAAALARTILDARAKGEDWASERVLARYQRARKPANLAMQSGMDAFCYGFANDAAPLKALRGLGLRLADKAGPIKRGVIRYALGISSPFTRGRSS